MTTSRQKSQNPSIESANKQTGELMLICAGAVSAPQVYCYALCIYDTRGAQR